MNGKHFYFKLIPPRSTFPGDITPQERALMAEHAAYFEQQFKSGKVLIYGPVMAPQESFGMGILEVADEAELRQIAENDPSVRGGLNRFEFYPMMVAAARGKSQQ